MSSNNFTCRDKYYSYGSYLRSRGYDKEICALVTDIEQGKIPIGPIIPGSCPNKPTTIKNDVTINPCQLNTGILRVNGGSVGKAETIIDISSTNGFLAASSNYGIQSNTGIRSLGPIVQVTDCSHYNFFGSKFHIFGGGIDMQTGVTDCSTNVIIRGNLLVDGSTVELGGYIGESLDLITLPSFDRTTFRIFRSSDASGNMVEYYVGDNSGSIITSNWETTLTYAVDGNRGAGGTTDGSTDTQGHVRSLRGITVSNPPQYNQPIDICYNTDISGTSIALDVYGDIIMNSGNNGAPGNIDLSGGSINFYENGTNTAYISSNGDASFNGHLTVTDLSVINVMTVGTATTFVDTSNVKTNNLTIRSTTNPNVNFSTFSESPTGLSITAGTNGNRNIKLIANKTIMNDASMLDVSAQNLDVSNTTNTPILNVGTTATINEAIIDTSLVTNFIRSKVNNDLTIRAAPTGNKNVVFDASTVIISDLSVNSANYNNLSVNDLSVISSAEFSGDVSMNDTLHVAGLLTADSSLVTDFIRSKVNNDLIIRAAPTGNKNVVFDANKVVISDLSVNSANYNNLSVNDLSVISSAEFTGDVSMNDTLHVAGILTADSSLVTDFIRSKVNNDLIIRAAPTGNKNVVFDANKVVISDLSVNTFASIFDLSVISTLTIGASTTTIDTSGITCDTVTANTFIGDISSNVIVDISNAIALLDNSVNALETTISNYDISFVTNDLSVNTYASFNDVSINTLEVGDNTTLSELSGNFLISNKSDGITIQTNGGTNEKITIQTLQGNNNDSISIKSSSGGVDISADQDIDLSANGKINFTASDYIFNNNNAKTTNIIGTTTRTLTNYGSSTSVLDISASSGFNQGTHDLKLVQILYSDLSNSSTAFINNSNNLEIKFSEEDFSGSIVEIFAELPMKKPSGAGADAITLDLSSNSIIHEIDTRSIAKGLLAKRRAGFGPITLLFNGTDNSSLDQPFNFRLNSQVGSIETSNIRLTIKQKSII